MCLKRQDLDICRWKEGKLNRREFYSYEQRIQSGETEYMEITVPFHSTVGDIVDTNGK